MLADFLYSLTARDDRAQLIALAAQRHTIGGRSVASANVQDVYTLSNALPRLWSPRTLYVEGSGGGAQTINAILIGARGPNTSILLYVENVPSPTFVRRSIFFPSDLWFDSRYVNQITATIQFSSGAIANNILSDLTAVTIPIGNVAADSFTPSGAP